MHAHSGRPIERIARSLAYWLGAMLLLVLMAIGELSYVSWFDNPSDTVAYWDGGTRILQGVDLYSAQDPHGVLRPYIYPPAFAAIFSIFVSLGPALGMALWSVSHFLLLGAVLYQLWQWSRRVGDRSGYLLPCLLLALLFSPLAQEFSEGQVNLLVTLLVLNGLLCLSAGKNAAAGLLLAGAAHVKVFPGVAILFLLVQRKFRAAAWMGAGLAVFVLLPWPVAALELGVWNGLTYAAAQYWHWGTEVVWGAVSTQQVGGLSYLQSPNLSLSAVLARMFGAGADSEHGLAVAVARTLSHLLLACMLATAIWGAWRKRGGKYATMAWPALGIIALQLGNVICWGHHFVMLALPATVLWCASGKAGRRWLWCLASAPLMIAGVALLLATVGRGAFRLRAELNATEGLEWGVQTWGAILIWALTAVFLWRSSARELDVPARAVNPVS